MKPFVPRTALSALLLVVVVALTFSQARVRAAAQSQDPAGDTLTDGQTTPYVIQRGDQIDIRVAGHDELKSSLVVLPDGSISVPDAGTIQAAGLTVQKLTGLLVTRLGVTINQPDVSVSVHATVAKVSVLGGVRNPGQFDIGLNTRILDVVASAGGLSADAPLSTGTLVRAGGDGAIPIDFDRLYASPTSDLNMTVKPGDVLLVETQNPFQVQVSGEVAKPGAYPVQKDGTPIMDVILLAQGPTKSADMKYAQIMHAGAIEVVDLSTFGTTLTGPSNTMRLYPGDVLQIPKIVDRFAVLGEVRTSGAYDIVDGKPVGLKSALVMAGGTTDEADLKHISLLRTDAKGTTMATTVDGSRVLTGQAPDVTLEPGDIVYVPVEHPKAPFNPLSLVSLVPILSFFH